MGKAGVPDVPPAEVYVEIPPSGFFPWEGNRLRDSEVENVLEFSGAAITTAGRTVFDSLSNDEFRTTNGKEEVNPEKKGRLIKLSALLDDPFMLEYFTELSWVTRRAKDVNKSECFPLPETIKSSNTHPAMKTYCRAYTSRSRARYRVRTPPRSCLPSALPLFLMPPENRVQNLPDSTAVSCSSDTVVVVPSMSLYQREQGSRSLSSSYDAISPTSLRSVVIKGRIPRSCRALLSACHPLRSRYGQLHTYHYNKDLLLDSAPEPSANGSSDETEVTSDSRQQDVVNCHYSSLLLNPLEPSGLRAFMTQLNATPRCKGVPSPISPVPPDPQPQLQQSFGVTGLQPQHTRRNRSRYCVLHQVKETGNDIAGKSVSGSGGWCWDKSEPLGLPALCSCHNEELYRIWDYELKLHRTHCGRENTTIRCEDDGTACVNLKEKREYALPEVPFSGSAGLHSVDWNAVLRHGDFSSFLTDIFPLDAQHQCSTSPGNREAPIHPASDALQWLHYCFTCGGLPYVPFSFIEVALNREIPTLHDLARRLPLPVPTELFCDGGLRVTACLVTRCRLHEWLALKTLSYINMDYTARVYQVCSQFIYPFHRIPDPSPSSPDAQQHTAETNLRTSFKDSTMCARHNLVHRCPPPKCSITDPPRFTLLQHRRPYCLRRRSGLTDLDLVPPDAPSPVPSEEALRLACFAWLKDQQTLAAAAVRPSERSATNSSQPCVPDKACRLKPPPFVSAVRERPK